MGSLQHFPDLIAGFKGPTSKATTSKEKEGKGKREKKEGSPK